MSIDKAFGYLVGLFASASAALALATVLSAGARIPPYMLEGWQPATDTECEVWSAAYQIGGDNTPAWIARIYRDWTAN